MQANWCSHEQTLLIEKREGFGLVGNNTVTSKYGLNWFRGKLSQPKTVLLKSENMREHRSLYCGFIYRDRASAHINHVFFAIQFIRSQSMSIFSIHFICLVIFLFAVWFFALVNLFSSNKSHRLRTVFILYLIRDIVWFENSTFEYIRKYDSNEII